MLLTIYTRKKRHLISDSGEVLEDVNALDASSNTGMLSQMNFLYLSNMIKLKLQMGWIKPGNQSEFSSVQFSSAIHLMIVQSQAIYHWIPLDKTRRMVAIALFVSSRSWDNFVAQFFHKFGNMGDEDEDDMLDESSKDERAEHMKLIHEDQPVAPETSQKKDKQKARVIDDKQVKHQSTTAKPDAKTSANNPQKEKKSSKPEATQILTGYKAVRDEQERI
ncbi:hypothetical protein RhiirA4_479007 [Rhizophagus irregularis]|uniref:Uncharacterized protein n=1 Tax=Rhizophagus irregularis TaxID=588596 RepID=A0A2I1HFQ9_9GLOM|nr:hypothetical protein RhiirA4_479007 [Rhizophagus irregularis]